MMTRALSHLFTALLVSAATLALAEDFPARPIKILVGAPAGGTTYTIARAIAEPLS